MFKDRRDAGRRLAEQLMHFKGDDPVVLARPRGGVPVGYEVAQALEAPLDLVVVRKIPKPDSPGSLGSVVGGERTEVFIQEVHAKAAGVPLSYVDDETARQREAVERQREQYLEGRDATSVRGRTVIVVDDGVATGETMRVILRTLRHAKPDRLVLAVPVAPEATIDTMRQEADEIVVAEQAREFRAVASAYENFEPTSDEEIRHFLDMSRPH